jgi:hypothetical protein
MTTSDIDQALKTLNIEVRYILISRLFFFYAHVAN